MHSGERIVFMANCKTFTAMITDFSNPASKVEYGSKDKIALVTEKHIHIYNTLADYDAQEYRLVGSSNPFLEKPPSSIDLTEFPFYTVQYLNKEQRAVEGTELVRDLFKSHPNVAIDNTTPTVFLVDHEKRKIDIFTFQSKQDSQLFCRAMQIGRGIFKYLSHIRDNGLTVNKNFLRHIQNLVVEFNNYAQVDPSMLIADNEQSKDITSLTVLMAQSKSIHKLKVMYQMVNLHALDVLDELIQSDLRNTIRYLSLTNTRLTDQLLKRSLNSIIKADKIIDLDLSQNNLTDLSLVELTVVIQNCRFIKKISLADNEISLDSPNVSKNFANLLKLTNQKLVIDLSRNLITDASIQLIQIAVIGAEGLPLVQLDLSFNLLTSYGIWRLYMGLHKYRELHQDLILFLGPYPLNQLFLSPSNSAMRHTLIQMPEKVLPSMNRSFQLSQTNRENEQTSLKIMRRKYSDRNLPSNRKQVQIIGQIKQRIHEMVIKDDYIQRFEQLCKEIGAYPFETPMVALKELYQHLWAKLNQALLVRDHYTVNIIRTVAPLIGLQIGHFHKRFQNLETRKKVVLDQIYKILNFLVPQQIINRELDDLCRQCLRLDLRGQMIDFILLLKFQRDQLVDQYLQQGVTCQDILFQGRQDNIQDIIDQCHKNQIFPRELIEEADLNPAWYSRWINSDFVYLSKFDLSPDNLQAFKQILVRLQKKKELTSYVHVLVDRINFMKGEFVNNDIKLWRKLFSQKKLNPARLVNLFTHPQRVLTYYEQYLLKKNIHRQIILPESLFLFFQHEKPPKYKYMRSGLDDSSLYGNYESLYELTKSSNAVYQEFKPHLIEFLETAQQFSQQNLLMKFIGIAQNIKTAKKKEVLEVQFYLHIIYLSREGLFPRNMFNILPIITSYIPLPKDIYPIFLYFLISLPYKFNQTKFTLNQNYINMFIGKPVVDSKEEFIYRDWVPRPTDIGHIVKTNGFVLVRFDFQFKFYTVPAQQSITVGEFVVQILSSQFIKSKKDRIHFWLFKVTERGEECLNTAQHVGEVIADLKTSDSLVLRRRVFSPFYKFKLQSLQISDLRQIFLQAKRDFLAGKIKVADQSYFSAILHLLNYYQKYSTVQISKSSLTNCIRDLEKMADDCISKFPSNRSRKEFLNEIRLRLNYFKLQNQRMQSQTIMRKLLISIKGLHEFGSSTIYAQIDTQEGLEFVKLSVNFWGVGSSAFMQTIDYSSLLCINTTLQGLTMKYVFQNQVKEQLFKVSKSSAHRIIQDIIIYCRMQITYPSEVLLKLLNFVEDRTHSDVLFGLGTVITSFSPFLKNQFWVKTKKPRKTIIQSQDKKSDALITRYSKAAGKEPQDQDKEKALPRTHTPFAHKKEEEPTPLSQYEGVLLDEIRDIEQLRFMKEQQPPAKESSDKIINLFQNPNREEWMQKLIGNQVQLDQDLLTRKNNLKNRLSKK